MNNYLLIIGIFSIIAGIIVQLYPKSRRKPVVYASEKARRLSAFNQRLGGIPSILIGIQIIGMELTRSTWVGIVFIIGLGLCSVAYITAYFWIYAHTPSDKPSDYDI